MPLTAFSVFSASAVFRHFFPAFFSLLLFVVRPCLGQTQSPVIDRIVVEGNTFINEDRIKDLMITKTGGLFRKKQLNQALLRADVNAIENFYRNSGFLSVRVRSTRDALRENRVVVRIAIDEGPRYRVRTVAIVGNRYLAEDDIRKNLLTKAGLPYYQLFAAADKRAIAALAERHALLDAETRLEQTLSEADTSITVTFFIDEGEPSRVGEIRVRGLQKTHPFVVLRELELRKGDLYDNSKMARSQTRLFQTGLFRSVRMEPARSDSATHARDLLVSVIELPGGEFSFGGGFASVERFRGSFSIAHRNFLGRAITIGTNAQASLLVQQVDAGITQPWLFKTRTTGTLRGFFTRQDRRSHIQREFGASIIGVRELSRALRSQTTYTIKNVRVTSLSDSLTAILQGSSVADSLRSRREGSLTQLVLYDTRDDLLNPTQGMFSQVQANLASPWLGSSSANQNSTLTLNGVLRKYIPLGRFPDIATSVSFGYVRALSKGVIPLDKRLLLGGDKSVRGYAIHQIGQPDGGVVAFSSQNEIRIPVGSLLFAGFVDLGGTGKTLASFVLNDIQIGYGGGLRIGTPIGMIRGDIGFHPKGDIDPPTAGLYERTYFYFGLGQAF
ncbi:MAG: BamA/TamA family outer membrane protein [candidate division Zixibacteria bacterium]|nr:BamA/TamA family outer membrane protein [candidate division Zixibacteria bacterium]